MAVIKLDRRGRVTNADEIRKAVIDNRIKTLMRGASSGRISRRDFQRRMQGQLRQTNKLYYRLGSES